MRHSCAGHNSAQTRHSRAGGNPARNRHCEERACPELVEGSDVAIQEQFILKTGLLRCARNDTKVLDPRLLV